MLRCFSPDGGQQKELMLGEDQKTLFPAEGGQEEHLWGLAGLHSKRFFRYKRSTCLDDILTHFFKFGPLENNSKVVLTIYPKR